MMQSFVLRADERGHNVIFSVGSTASYVAGHTPSNFISRESSFNFHEYQSGRPGFGAIRVFGDEMFHGAGCGYNMHPHHNFVICAFVLEGELTHLNTPGRGTVDQLRQGDYYVFSAGSGGKHCETEHWSGGYARYISLADAEPALPASDLLSRSFRRSHAA